MRKSTFKATVLFVLSVFLSSCISVGDSSSVTQLNQHLISNSIELTCTMGSLAQSAEYIRLISAQPDITELITEIGANDFTSPNMAVLIKVPDATIDSVINRVAGELDLPDDAYEMVVTRMCSAIPGSINSLQGVNSIVLTSILAVSNAFLSHEDFTENTYVILIYDNYNSVTFFRRGVEGITSAATTFLFIDDDMKKIVTEGTVIDYLSEMIDISGVTVEYVGGDQMTDYR